MTGTFLRRRAEAVAAAVLLVAVVAFVASGLTKAPTYRSSTVVNVSVKRPVGSVTDALQLLLPAVSATVTATPARTRAAAGTAATAPGTWSVTADSTPGTGLMTIAVVAASGRQAQQLAAGYVRIAAGAAATFSPGTTLRTIDPPSTGRSLRRRTLLSDAAAGCALGTVLAMLVLYAAGRGGARRRGRAGDADVVRLPADATSPVDGDRPVDRGSHPVEVG